MADESQPLMFPRMKSLFGAEEAPRNMGERNKSVRYFSQIFVPGAFLFGCLDIYLGRLFVGFMLLASAAVVAICWRMCDGGRVTRFEFVTMVVCTAVASSLIYDGGILNSGIYWVLLYPFIAFFIRGQRQGWYWVTILFLMIATLMILQSLNWIELAYDAPHLFYFTSALVFFTLLAAGLNLLRQRYERLLEVEVDTQSRTALNYLKRLEYLALYDPLTDLPNRHLAKDRIARAIEGAKRESNSFAVALMDIDRFHEVNVLLGHRQADAVLKKVAKRLAAIKRGVDSLARLEGDEFLMVWPRADATGAEIVVNKILQAMKKPFAVNGTHIHISLCIGVVIYPQHGDTVSTLLQHASTVQRRAKAERLTHAIYQSEWHSEMLRRIHLLEKMRDSIAHEKMALVYQPQMQMADGQVSSVEALLRWHLPEDGYISPAEFIPLAEQTRLIDELTFMVLEMAARQNREWRDNGLDIGISVNLSARHLIDLDLPDKIYECLHRYDGKPHHFMLEITETDIMAHPELALSVMQKIKAMGIPLSIDDFGTGYSSLAYLRQLPVDELKIDQAFIRDLMNSESDRKIVTSMLTLGHDLDLCVVAEGIETIETWQALKKLGIDKGQGFLISRPLPSAELVTWLNGREGSDLP